MPVISLKLIRENTIRDYINQFLMNIGQNSGEEWWNSSQAGRVLSRLADATRPQVTDSSELCIDCEDALVVGIWNSGMDARALERLMRDMQNQTEKIAKEKAAGASQKITIQFLLFTNDLKSRIALEFRRVLFRSPWPTPLEKSADCRFRAGIPLSSTGRILESRYVSGRSIALTAFRCRSLPETPIRIRGKIL